MRERSSKSLLANVLDLEDDFRGPINGSNHTNYRVMRVDSEYHRNDIHHNSAPPAYGLATGSDGSDGNNILKEILKEIQYLSEQKKKEEEYSDVCNDWKFAAMVIDRLCLWMFTVFTIISTFAILFSAPNII